MADVILNSFAVDHSLLLTCERNEAFYISREFLLVLGTDFQMLQRINMRVKLQSRGV